VRLIKEKKNAPRALAILNLNEIAVNMGYNSRKRGDARRSDWEKDARKSQYGSLPRLIIRT